MSASCSWVRPRCCRIRLTFRPISLRISMRPRSADKDRLSYQLQYVRWEIPIGGLRNRPRDIDVEKRDQATAYRIARETYPFRCCVVCGLQIQTCLTVAHLDHDGGNNAPDNLAWLCWTHHWMFDADFYPLEAIREMRRHWQTTKGVPRRVPMIGAGLKAVITRRRSEIAKRAARTRAERRGEPAPL
jgi:hypothetical protein